MKKFLTMFLVLAMVLSLGCTAFAATHNAIPASEDEDVTVNVDTVTETVYKVVVEWTGIYDYTYYTEKTWDPETHTYETTNKWTWNDGDSDQESSTAPQITIGVYNHSNAQINAKLSLSGDEVVVLPATTTATVNAATEITDANTQTIANTTGSDQFVCTVGTTAGTGTLAVAISTVSTP